MGGERGGHICLTSASQESILVTATASSMLFSKFIFLQRVARTHSSVVRRSAKLSLHRSQPETTETCTFCFSLSFSANLFMAIWLWGAMPPVQVKTRGVKSARSTSLMRCPYSRIFWSSAVLNSCAGFWDALLRAKGETTFMSKYACPPESAAFNITVRFFFVR